MNYNITLNYSKLRKDSNFSITLFLYIFFILTLTIIFIPKNSYAKTKNMSIPKFQNKYDTIYIGKSYKYKIKNMPQNTTVRFTINNKKLANINSKTGLLVPKKAGLLKLKGTIKSKKILIILTKKITIKNKSNSKTNNEIFYPPSHINNINFTVKLKCAKIMQQSQVENSSISLSKNDFTANANFKSLSDDGRYITYELNNQSVKSLSPGDSSMNGTYQLACTLSKEKYSIDYYEHVLGQSVTGFIFDNNRCPLENANITLTDNNVTVSTETDKNGYYMIRFPKASNVNMTVSYKNNFTKYSENISLKITKSICKNIVLHDDNNQNLSASFQITDTNNQPSKIEITSLDSENYNKLLTTSKTFFTDSTGKLLLTQKENSISQTDADIVNISDNQKLLSHNDNTYITDMPKESFTFLYNQTYFVKIYSINDGSYSLKSEFYFSFNDFISKHIIFNLSLPVVEQTCYPETLLPITTGSNISVEKINYCNVQLFRTGIEQPLCTFNFSENTPANFQKQIHNMNLYLTDGNIYYAIFQLYDYEDKKILFPVLYRFSVNNSKIKFESNKIEFTDSFSSTQKQTSLPAYKNTLNNVSMLPQDTSCINTVLCSYTSYGDIKKSILTSLSSQLLQYELLNSANICITYTNNSEFLIRL